MIAHPVTAHRQTRHLSDGRSEPGSWHWPDRDAVQVYARLFLVIAVLFVAGYGGANWLAGHRESPLRLYLQAELAIPFVPEMIWVYLSINLLFALPLFRLRTQELTLLGRRMIVTTVIAVAFFLLAPTALGFARQPAGSDLASVYQLLYVLDAPYNCAPSLHVAYASQIILALAHRGPYRLRAALALWLLLIMASTVLTHQHHLLDLAGGLLLTASTRLATARRGEGAGGALLRPRRMVSHAAGADR